MDYIDIRKDIIDYAVKHSLTKKWNKTLDLFKQNLNHPSLNIELLEPKHRGIFSIRIDLKYRALFFKKNGKVEFFAITNHYKK